jgi:hypothetical protein
MIQCVVYCMIQYVVYRMIQYVVYHMIQYVVYCMTQYVVYRMIQYVVYRMIQYVVYHMIQYVVYRMIQYVVYRMTQYALQYNTYVVCCTMQCVVRYNSLLRDTVTYLLNNIVQRDTNYVEPFLKGRGAFELFHPCCATRKYCPLKPAL